MKGFSPSNLKYMRRFAEECPECTIGQQPTDQLPWFHIVTLITLLSKTKEREWYAARAIQHGWSRNILAMQIDSRAREKHGKTVSNFSITLPPADSDMAAQIFKDPYIFDFLGTADTRREREVEQALVDHIQKFLLELGALQFFSWNNCPLRISFGGIRKRGDMPLYCESELLAKLEQSEAETAKLRNRLKTIWRRHC